MSRERVLKTYVMRLRRITIMCLSTVCRLSYDNDKCSGGGRQRDYPNTAHYLSAKGLELFAFALMSMVKRQINPNVRIDGILMTMVMPRTNISKEITATVKSAYGQKIKVFDTEITAFYSVRWKLTAEGKSIFAYDKSGKVAAAYEQFGKEGGRELARSRETKIELTAYDDLFQTDESRAEAKLSKIEIFPYRRLTSFQTTRSRF